MKIELTPGQFTVDYKDVSALLHTLGAKASPLRTRTKHEHEHRPCSHPGPLLLPRSSSRRMEWTPNRSMPSSAQRARAHLPQALRGLPARPALGPFRW